MGLELSALVVGSGFEPLKAKPADLQSASLGRLEKISLPLSRQNFKSPIVLNYFSRVIGVPTGINQSSISERSE